MSPSSIGKTFGEHVQNIKIEIQQLKGECRVIFAHRSRISRLIQNLQDFAHQISHDHDLHITSVIEEIHFRQLTSVLSDVRNLITNFSEKDFINFVMNEDLDEISNKLSKIRESFNESVSALNLSEFKLSLNEEEDKIDKCEDYLRLLQRLSNIQFEIKAQEKRRKQLINQLEDFVDNNDDFLADEKAMLSEDEVEEEFNEFHKDMEINPKDYVKVRVINHGAYSEVFSGFNKKTESIVTIKQMHCSTPSVKEVKYFKNEIETLLELKFPAVLPFLGFSSRIPLKLVTGYMAHGALFERLHDPRKQIEPTSKTIIAIGIALGMMFLHQKGYIHTDLNTSSILLDADDYPYIADFNLMEKVDDSSNRRLGIRPWNAPEMMTSDQYNEKVDVYSYGIILWELLTHEIPFRGMSPYSVVYEVKENNIRPLIPQNCPPRLAKLIEACWDQIPEKRPDFTSIVTILKEGKISYLGTENGLVNTYLSQYYDLDIVKDEKLSETDNDSNEKEEEESEDSKEISLDISPEKFLTLMEKDPYIIDKFEIQNSNDQSKLLKFITPEFENFVKTHIDVCDSNKYLNSLTLFLFNALKPKDAYKTFEKTTLLPSLLKLFKSYGSSKVPHFVEVVDLLFTYHHVSFTSNNIKSLSLFLLSSEFSDRKRVSKILLNIMKYELFLNESDLTLIVPNLILNLKPNTNPDLLSTIIKLSNKLAAFQHPLAALAENDALCSYLSLCLVKDKTVVSHSFKLINTLLSMTKPLDSFMNQFILDLPNFNCDEKDSLLPLIVASHLVKKPNFAETLAANSESLLAFNSYLQKKDEKVIGFALRLTYSIVTGPIKNGANSVSTSFSIFTDQLIKLLSHKNKLYVMMASSCLTAIIPKIKTNYDKVFTSPVIKYLSNSFSLNDNSQNNDDKETLIALRLAGSISLQYEGSEFLQKEKIIDQIVELLNPKETNKEKTKLLLMILLSQAENIPSCKPLINSISTIIKFLGEDSQINLLVLNFIENTVADCSATEIASRSIDLFLKYIDEKSLQKIVISIIFRISTSVESWKTINNLETVKLIVSKTIPFISSDNQSTILKIYEALSRFDNGKNVLKAHIKKFDGYLSQMEIDSTERPVCLQLISRLSHE